MTWNVEFEDTEWKIESNSTYIEGDDFFYRWNKSFIKITCKNVTIEDTLTVDGIDYVFYNDNETAIIEITDLIRSATSGTISFVNEVPLTVYEINWFSINGEIPSVLNMDVLPSEIPFNSSSTLPFYIQTVREMEVKTTSDWSSLVDGNGIKSVDVVAIADFNNQVRTTETVNVYTDFINQPCWNDKILVEWVGRFGELKSWWFTVDKTIYGSDKQINIQTFGNGYNTLKNKITNLLVSHKRADPVTQHYLSDIVLSDEVYVYTSSAATSKTQVRIENSNIEVSARKQDINLIINLFVYDTI